MGGVSHEDLMKFFDLLKAISLESCLHWWS